MNGESVRIMIDFLCVLLGLDSFLGYQHWEMFVIKIHVSAFGGGDFTP